MTSIVQVPNICQYMLSNLGNLVIKSTMIVNCFEKIHQFLHYTHNNNFIPPNQAGHDILYRIRPTLETLRKRYQSIPIKESLSIDEQLYATKTRHFLKQYIPIKLHKWGYIF